MLPWGHLAVGYLCYSLYVRLRHHPFPEGAAVFALAIGTQFPDLVDKPLAWTLGVAPSGRSVGHSLVVAAILAAIVWMLVRRYGRRGEAIAFFVGYFSHIIVDAAPAALAGNWERLGFLFWPLTSAYEHPGEMDRSIVEFMLNIGWTGFLTVELLFSALAIVVWVSDGMPGRNVFGRLVVDRA